MCLKLNWTHPSRFGSCVQKNLQAQITALRTKMKFFKKNVHTLSWVLPHFFLEIPCQTRWTRPFCPEYIASLRTCFWGYSKKERKKSFCSLGTGDEGEKSESCSSTQWGLGLSNFFPTMQILIWDCGYWSLPCHGPPFLLWMHSERMHYYSMHLPLLSLYWYMVLLEAGKAAAAAEEKVPYLVECIYMYIHKSCSGYPISFHKHLEQCWIRLPPAL